MWFLHELLQGFHQKVLCLYAKQAEISGLPRDIAVFLDKIMVQAVEVNFQRGVIIKRSLRNTRGKSLQTAPRNSSPVLAQCCNSCGYRTHWQEDALNLYLCAFTIRSAV